MHADVNDCGLAVSVALTTASLHDSQVAIPMMKMSSERVDNLYDLMDAAYDAGPIYEVSKKLGHVHIIDKNSRGKDIIPTAPHEAGRYNERTAAERFNRRLKEEFGARYIMVRGACALCRPTPKTGNLSPTTFMSCERVSSKGVPETWMNLRETHQT